ncbi:MAG TPA: L-threonylcarbamoyladenylate synthase [Deltaproteobacteria bacterium]|nr:L-threonylcarbamoyladenylate synthase [Deltaproteobacteria bacterium]
MVDDDVLVTTNVACVADLMTTRTDSVVAYPTETFYGLGARAMDDRGLERVVAIKGRDAAKGMIVLVADMAMALRLARMEPWQRMSLETIWPAAVSVLVRAVHGLNPLLAPGGKIALRVSTDTVARELVERVGPITSTSANRSGSAAAATAREVVDQGLDIDAVLDGGPRPGIKPSTLVDFTACPPVCIREGAFPFSEIIRRIGPCRASRE